MRSFFIVINRDKLPLYYRFLWFIPCIIVEIFEFEVKYRQQADQTDAGDSKNRHPRNVMDGTDITEKRKHPMLVNRLRTVVIRLEREKDTADQVRQHGKAHRCDDEEHFFPITVEEDSGQK